MGLRQDRVRGDGKSRNGDPSQKRQDNVAAKNVIVTSPIYLEVEPYQTAIGTGPVWPTIRNFILFDLNKHDLAEVTPFLKKLCYRIRCL